MDNLICAKCNEKIEEADLVECPHCWEIYHRECWEKTLNCLSCKKFNVEFRKAEEEEAIEENQQETAEKEDDFKAGDIQLEEFSYPISKEPKDSPLAHTINMISTIVLIVGIVVALGYAIYMFILGGLTGGVMGLIFGAIIGVSSWVLSILIKGFAELVNNSQKNAHYLSRLVEKQEEKEE